MTRYNSFALLIVMLSFSSLELFSQYKLPFGDITLDQLSNKPYKPDPGADAIILSDIGVASFNYVNGFYVELERDVRIRIVNSDGFDYADIDIPYSSDDRISNFRASTFNTANGAKVETKIPKEGFITEYVSKSYKSLKFNFPDVHEGSVIEYSYIIRLTGSSLFSLVPWEFQSDIPTAYSSLTITYPEACTYKSIISGSSSDVRTSRLRTSDMVFGRSGYALTDSWSIHDMPAFREEPYIKSKTEHLTRVSFELERFDLPGIVSKEITPTYATLTSKLLEREDFGTVLHVNLKDIAGNITAGVTDDLAKLKKIHAWLSTNILWNGEEEYSASGPLRSVLRKKKGNSADINMLLIAMLRALNIRADPVILCTRSNGSLNEYSAVLSQFNYLLAYVSAEGDFYLVDATDPLRPFNLLPPDCLNGNGRLISEYDSKFIPLRNNEKSEINSIYNLTLSPEGNISGYMSRRSSDYSALNIRRSIKLESEEGYIDLIKSVSGDINLSDFKIRNISNPDSSLFENCHLNISNYVQMAGDEIIFSPYISLSGTKNPFISTERKFPVDFGSPELNTDSLILKIPEGYSVIEKPADMSLNIGQNDCQFVYRFSQTGNSLAFSSRVVINKTIYQPSDYAELRNFFSKILQKRTELVVLKKDLALK
jgi:transglutaminase-like putative cysteine protease